MKTLFFIIICVLSFLGCAQAQIIPATLFLKSGEAVSKNIQADFLTDDYLFLKDEDGTAHYYPYLDSIKTESGIYPILNSAKGYIPFEILTQGHYTLGQNHGKLYLSKQSSQFVSIEGKIKRYYKRLVSSETAGLSKEEMRTALITWFIESNNTRSYEDEVVSYEDEVVSNEYLSEEDITELQIALDKYKRGKIKKRKLTRLQIKILKPEYYSVNGERINTTEINTLLKEDPKANVLMKQSAGPMAAIATKGLIGSVGIATIGVGVTVMFGAVLVVPGALMTAAFIGTSAKWKQVQLCRFRAVKAYNENPNNKNKIQLHY